MLAIIGGTGMAQLACLDDIASAHYDDTLWRAVEPADFRQN